jgi:hypothetical protein
MLIGAELGPAGLLAVTVNEYVPTAIVLLLGRVNRPVVDE